MLPHPSTWNSLSRPLVAPSATLPSAFLAHVGIFPRGEYGIIINQGRLFMGSRVFKQDISH